MAGLRFVSAKMKLFIIITQVIAYLSCIIAIILKYTGNFNSSTYIILAILIPVLALFCNYFPIFNAYVDKKKDLAIYILTGTASALIVFFAITAFIAR